MFNILRKKFLCQNFIPKLNFSNTNSLLLAEQKDQIGFITLNNPKQRNSLSFNYLTSIQQQLNQFFNDSKVSVIVIKANGSVFSAGHDLKEVLSLTKEYNQEKLNQLFSLNAEINLQIQNSGKPVIAQIQGPAVAAGCQLISSCDIAIATQNSNFSTPGIKLGLFCSTPMVPLIRNINQKVAKEMLLTGEPISAERAVQVGLINKMVQNQEELDQEVLKIANQITHLSQNVVQFGKNTFNLIKNDKCIEESYKKACIRMTENAFLDDAIEGITAFSEKRHPKWK